MTSAERIRDIQQIDGQAFTMARQVAEGEAQRPGLAGQAEQLKARLLDHADALRSSDPEAHAQVRHRVSESLLDLNFVIADTGVTSLRLGDLLR